MLIVRGGRLVIDAPPQIPDNAERIFITHFHADHWGGLKLKKGGKIYGATVQQSVLLMMSFSIAGIPRPVYPLKTPVNRPYYIGNDKMVIDYRLRVVHAPETYNHLIIDKRYGFGIWYSSDIRYLPERTFNFMKSRLEYHNIDKLIVLLEATYFSENADPFPKDKIIGAKELIEMAELGTVVAPMLTTGRVFPFLKILKLHGYKGPVYMVKGTLTKMYKVLRNMKQTREEKRFYPLDIDIPVDFVSVGEAERILELNEPSIVIVGGGMLQSRNSLRLSMKAIENDQPVVVSSAQVEGTNGYQLAKIGKLYRVKHPLLRGHMNRDEWLNILNRLMDYFDIMVVPIHTTRTGVENFVEFAKENEIPIYNFKVSIGAMGKILLEVVRTRIGDHYVVSGIAPIIDPGDVGVVKRVIFIDDEEYQSSTNTRTEVIEI